MSGWWVLRNLARHPVRSLLAVAGIAVAAALLLDMVLLAGGMEKSFQDLLLVRGYQIRLSPKGTLPFDTEATLGDVTTTVARIRGERDVEAAGAILATSVFLRRRMADSLTPVVGYGIDPEGQGMYEVVSGTDLAPGDTTGLLLGEPVAARLALAVGDTVTMVGRLDPMLGSPLDQRALVVRATVRWLYDARDQLSVGTLLPVAQRLGLADGADRASAILVRAATDSLAPRVAERLAAAFPDASVNDIASVVVRFRVRLAYFRQVSIILGAISLVVTVLLVGTLLTITVSERLGEIVTLRALGVGRGTILRQVLLEGMVLTVLGSAGGLALGLATARYLDGILTSFPGLPAAISFFVPRQEGLMTAAAVLLVTGLVAGLYPAWLASRVPIADTLRAEAT